ncbi:Zinc finger, PMZ-type, partial [Cynara cardunculus var. scolymus]
MGGENCVLWTEVFGGRVGVCCRVKSLPFGRCSFFGSFIEPSINVMDYMSFNETFSKDIVEESSVFDSMNDCQGFDYGGENATAVNNETIEDQCNYSMRNEDGCNDRNETLSEHNDGGVVDFVDIGVASLSNEAEDYRSDGMGETNDGSKCWFPNVVKNKIENSYDCSCNCFVRNGILCRHALKVMLNDEVDRIPDKYILHCWKRDLVPVEWLPARFRYGEVDTDKERLMSVAYSYFERILGRVRNEKHILSKFVDQLQEWDTKIDSELPIQSHAQETTTSIKEFLGVSQPENIDVLPPTGIRKQLRLQMAKRRRESVGYVFKWLHMIREIVQN